MRILRCGVLSLRAPRLSQRSRRLNEPVSAKGMGKNRFCCAPRDRGWSHRWPGVFVYHAGGRSFGAGVTPSCIAVNACSIFGIPLRLIIGDFLAQDPWAHCGARSTNAIVDVPRPMGVIVTLALSRGRRTVRHRTLPAPCAHRVCTRWYSRRRRPGNIRPLPKRVTDALDVPSAIRHPHRTWAARACCAVSR